ncbi:MAG: M1 family aminopeptidase [Vicinamibacterales bacterium]
MKRRASVLFAIAVSLCGVPSFAQTASSAESDTMAAYRTIAAFELDGGSATVSNLIVSRDRVEMTFTGTFYFTKPVMGRITGAVFDGQGTFRAEPPPSLFEKQNLERLLKAASVESDFKTAVLRFTDDASDLIGPRLTSGAAAPPAIQELASQFGPRMLKETGANTASRLVLSLREHETPGVFLAQFDGGRRGRFTFLMDYQGRIPATNFSIDGGEKGLIFFYERRLFANIVWLAFAALDDYQHEGIPYSDAFDLVDVPAYRLTVDLREPRKALKISGRIDMLAKAARVSMIPFALTESLSEYDNQRLKKGMRLKSARMTDRPIEFIQEDWEGGFTLLLPAAQVKGDAFSVEFEAEGDFVNEVNDIECYFPLINDEWYPRHGVLGRSTFEITFLHPKRYTIASAGVQVKVSGAETVYQMQQPIALVTFAMGPYKLYSDTFKQAAGDVPLEFFSLPNYPIKEGFMLTEMGRSVSYFSDMFGAYPYPVLRAAFHPFGFGQSFASMLLVPNVDSATKNTYRFLSHEASHQWWGNIVGWRSYRDQWLSEGFAVYSGILYTGQRDTPSAARDLITAARNTLKEAPRTFRGGGTGTQTGVGAGSVTDIGPLVLGHRLATVESTNAYERLIYNKGALVLRMLHFLLSDLGAGDDLPFFKMMEDFVGRHRNGSATTESFVEVANEHFARSPIAQQFGMKGLDWFFNQWVRQTEVPTYHLDYTLEDQPGGAVSVKGTIVQEGAPEYWTMPVPVVFKFAGGKTEHATILARGPRQPVSLTLSARPQSVELDPDMWVLSEKTSAKRH